MSEPKACKVCGEPACRIDNAYDGEPRAVCYNRKCWLYDKPFKFDEWNTRPIEDALNQRIAYLESLLRWRPVSEIPTKGGFYEVKYWKFDRKYTDVVSWNPHTIGFYNLDADSVIEWRPIPELGEQHVASGE